jgi:hypothetical protein
MPARAPVDAAAMNNRRQFIQPAPYESCNERAAEISGTSFKLAEKIHPRHSADP